MTQENAKYELTFMKVLIGYNYKFFIMHSNFQTNGYNG